jgi:ABC-2 type transport system permease protein
VPTFTTTAAILLIAVPLLAMRLIAEERRNHTMVLLTSAPISIIDIVLGKFLALLGLLLAVILLVTLMPLSLSAATRLDYRLLGSILLGITLLAAAFSAVGLYASSLTTHPIVAALASFGALLAMLMMGDQVGDNLRARGLGVLAALAQVFTPVKNFEPLGRGLIDSYAIACLLLLTVLFLTLTVRQLEAQRLRG